MTWQTFFDFSHHGPPPSGLRLRRRHHRPARLPRLDRPQLAASPAAAERTTSRNLHRRVISTEAREREGICFSTIRSSTHELKKINEATEAVASLSEKDLQTIKSSPSGNSRISSLNTQSSKGFGHSSIFPHCVSRLRRSDPTDRLAQVPITNNSCEPALLPLALLASLCLPPSGFPDVPAGYREFAYVTNGASNTVAVLDLVNLRQDRTLRVGDNPTGIAASIPQRNEVYAVNSAVRHRLRHRRRHQHVAATIGVHRHPYFISVDAQATAPTSPTPAPTPSASSTSTAAARSPSPAQASSPASPASRLTCARSSSPTAAAEASPSSTSSPTRRPRTPCACAPPSRLPRSHRCRHPARLLQGLHRLLRRHQVMVISLAAAPGSWPAKQDPAAPPTTFSPCSTSARPPSISP